MNKISEYKELKEPCKTLIKKGICLGCVALENPNFTGRANCINIPNVTESIKQIHKNLGIQEKIWK